MGVTLEQDLKTELLDMIQIGIIQRVIEAVSLDDGTSKGKFTTSEDKPFIKDENGVSTSGMFSYSSVVDMLLCLYGYTRPDFDLALNRCSRYIFSTKSSQKLALKILASYLKQTKYHVLVLNPNSDVCKVDAYPDAYFSGMYGHEEPNYPTCTRSRILFIITFVDCLVLWFSKLQTKHTL